MPFSNLFRIEPFREVKTKLVFEYTCIHNFFGMINRLIITSGNNIQALTTVRQTVIEANGIVQRRLLQDLNDDSSDIKNTIDMRNAWAMECRKLVNKIDDRLVKLRVPSRTPEENRAAYANRRNDYLKRYNRKVFEKDHWICAKCGNKIKNKTDARAYNIFNKFYLSDAFAFEECFITVCRVCYADTIGIYNTPYCDCIRKYPPHRDCAECMIPPSLKELLKMRVGKDNERWLNMEF